MKKLTSEYVRTKYYELRNGAPADIRDFLCEIVEELEPIVRTYPNDRLDLDPRLAAIASYSLRIVNNRDTLIDLTQEQKEKMNDILFELCPMVTATIEEADKEKRLDMLVHQFRYISAAFLILFGFYPNDLK